MKNFNNRLGFIWLDGRFVKWNQAKLHVLSHGLHYASCVFEGARIYNGKIFKRGNKRVKRFECLEVATGRLYLFNPNAEVEYLK